MHAPGNPYRCARRGLRYLLHVSGGRTSGMLLYRVLDAYGSRLPGNVRAVFANTGKEHAKTLAFLREMERRWHVPITWVEYVYRAEARGGIGDPKNTFRIVDHDTASRRGEPFAALIRSRRMLPNAHRRLCTAELKVETAARFARTRLRWWRPRPHSILGIRHDEPKRWTKALWEQCRTVYPLVDARVAKSDVERFWRSQPFDLGIGHDLGNCDLCFLKGKWKLIRLITQYPERADWWIEQERYRRSVARTVRKPELTRFLMRYTYEDLRAAPMMPFDELIEDAEANDDPGVSCFCGD